MRLEYLAEKGVSPLNQRVAAATIDSLSIGLKKSGGILLKTKTQEEFTQEVYQQEQWKVEQNVRFFFFFTRDMPHAKEQYITFENYLDHARVLTLGVSLNKVIRTSCRF